MNHGQAGRARRCPPTPTMRADDLLIFADGEPSADLRYAIGMGASEPVVYLRVRRRGLVLLGDADLERGRGQVEHCRVLPLSRYIRNGEARKPSRTLLMAEAIRRVAKERKAGRLLVPAGFPLGLARALRRLKVRVKPCRDELLFPEREIKSSDEVEMIRAAVVMAEVGMAEAVQALRTSKVGPRNRLLYRGAPLTTDRVRSIIQVAVWQAGGRVVDAVVAGGHRTGVGTDWESGPLVANEPIVLGITPRSEKTGYHGEITRTFVRGRASETVRQLDAAVGRAQGVILNLVRDGAQATAIHRAVQSQLRREGFSRDRAGRGSQGASQSTGQGIGLDSREPPSVGADSPSVLQSGHVLSVGPRVCAPGAGIVRATDVLVVTRNGARALSQFERVLEV